VPNLLPAIFISVQISFEIAVKGRSNFHRSAVVSA